MTTSFQADIRPLFTERDIQGMIKGFNLASYDEVKAHAAAIYDRIRGIGGAVMPPAPPRGEGEFGMGNGALPNGPSYRAHPRLYQGGHS